MEKKKLIEETLKKFAQLEGDDVKQFALGYVTGKHDEKQAEGRSR